MRKLIFFLTPFQTFLVYVVVAALFIIPGVVFAVDILIYIGIFALCYSPVAALITAWMRR